MKKFQRREHDQAKGTCVSASRWLAYTDLDAAHRAASGAPSALTPCGRLHLLADILLSGNLCGTSSCNPWVASDVLTVR